MSLLTPEIAALEGTQRVYTAPEPFGGAAGRYFGLAVGDHNPLYSDPEYARAQGLDGVTAPLTLVCETNQYADLPMDPEGYAGHTWQLDVPGTRQVRGGNSYTFHRRLRPSDVVTATWAIDQVTSKTNRSGHEMLVIASSATYTNQDGDLLAENAETIIFVALEPAVAAGEKA
ncbi:FAS1-like dehydratase domain-containing protein [Nocardioides gilvus]|uniref:FAS1-like dehydratase domain-containing protein n=1 Tax=Nocardioides gilvus TaxID=1735589 RepID=UPI000D74AEA9|nr:MaoC family dehydratase N-terminal domain-containing protein [Nocardioides gilvus]